MKGKIMEKIKLNETPVRTARNFKINNIQLEDVQIPENIGNFVNVKKTGQSEQIQMDENCSKIHLQYGLHERLTNQVLQKANQKLHVNITGEQEKEVKIDFCFDENNLNLVDHLEIVADEKAQATIFLTYQTANDFACFHNGILRIHAKKNANINVILLNLMNLNSNHFLAIESTLEENAKLQFCMIDFGGKNSITNLYSNLCGNFSENAIDTIYLGKQNQLFDLNYIAELRGEKSKIDMEIQGALKDVAKKHFKGTIDFKKGCKKAKGNENEACMLLSDTAKSIALPMLLCSEEDVEGNHSSSAGKIGEKELFYMMSRGFEQKEAMKLMVRAKFNKVLEKIKNEGMKEFILQKIDEKLD